MVRVISFAPARVTVAGVGVVVAVSATAAAGGSVLPSAQALTWSLVASPSPGTDFNVLAAVSCTSAGACTAVGYRNQMPLVESWNGTRWSAVPSPSPHGDSTFNDVSCVPAAGCTAVGYRYYTSNARAPLIASWNGTSWSLVPSPREGSDSVLYGVSCVSAAACTAVGSHSTSTRGLYKPLVESWDGTSWSVVPSPSPGNGYNAFNGVFCLSADACTAVGEHDTASGQGAWPLIASWNGSRWSLVPSPRRGPVSYLQRMSCTAAAACMAVGAYRTTAGAFRTFIQSWNGTSWSVVPSPSPGSYSALDGVSCVSAATCTAVGSDNTSTRSTYSTLIESWNGTSWSLVPSPNRGSSHLNDVSCISGTVCTAVGSRYTRALPHQRTLTEAGAAQG